MAPLRSPDAILDALGHCVGVLSERGTILFVNRAATDAFGASASELIGTSIWQTPWWSGDPAAEARLIEAIRRTVQGEGVTLEDIVRSGAERSATIRMEFTALPSDDAGRTRVVWSAVDITEVRDLEAVRSRMAAIIERSPDFVATLTPGGRLLSLNRAGRALVGLAPNAEVAGLAMVEFYPQWARTLIEEVGIPAAQEEGSWTGRSALVGADGREVPTSQVIVAHTDGDGVVRFFSTVSRDATKERRAENRLETEVAVSQALDESASLESAIPEILDPFIRILGADLAEFWIPGERGLHRTATAGPAAEGSVVEESENTLQAALERSGRAILVCPAGVLGTGEEDVRLPDFAASGLGLAIGTGRNLAGVVTVYWKAAINDLGLHTSAGRLARDISAFVRREEAEKSLRESRLLAEEASRAKGEFVANMSHEIRSPMTAILGYVEVLGGSLEDPDDLQILEVIRRNGSHLLSVVSDILDLSRIEAGRLELTKQNISPAEIVGDLLGLMSLRASDRGLTLSAGFDGEIPDRIETDPVRVRQILVNLIGNAIKFTPRGAVTLTVRERDGMVEFKVDDTGIGMPPDRLEELFEPFAQLDTSSLRAYEGTGLGLTISARLATALGGTLRAESREGIGSSFTLALPVGISDYEMVDPTLLDEKVSVPESDGQSPARRLRGRILAVDDRLDMRILYRHLFEDAGAQVEVASDGVSAIRRAQAALAENREFDVIVMDVQMPGMDGLSATRELREKGFDGAIIALTAGAQPTDREKALEAGCDEYAAKPIGGRELIDLVWRYMSPDESEPQRGEREPAAEPRVLLIEDDADVAEVMEILFTEWGCAVRVARSGREAMDRAGEGPVDVIFSDLSLPDMDGAELLPRLRRIEACRDAYCVSLSGHAGSGAERRSREAGFARHLVKPASLDTLREVLGLDARKERSVPVVESQPDR